MALALAVLLSLLLLAGPGQARLETVELGLYNLRMGLVDLPSDLRLRPIGLDESLGQTGWNAQTARRLLALLQGGGVRGVYLLDPPSSGWSTLGDSLTAFPVAAVRASTGTPGLPPGSIPTASAWVPDSDGVVRRVSLRAPGSGTPRPGPALLMVAALDAVPPASIRFTPQSIRVGARTIPTDSQHCIWVRFPGGAGQPGQGLNLDIHPISAARFLQPGSPVLRRLDGTVAIVGNFAVEARDLVLTAGGTMRTMEVETCVLDTILSGRFLRRPGAAWGVAIPLVLALTMGFCLPLLRPGWQLMVTLTLSLAWTVLNVVAFTRGLWLDLATPLAVVILVFLLAACLGLARSTRIFGQFLEPELARGLVAGPEGAGLGGQEKVCTIMFFSLPACFKQDLWDPATLLERRNQFTSMAADVVQAWGGRVMDFQGDAQMVLFGAPRELPNHAAAATGAALEMVEQASRRVAGWDLEDPALGEIHAGVCTGPLAVGFVGSERHKEFAALGDTTNVAARLYAAAIRLGIPVLVAGSTMEAARGAILADPLPPVALKGKSQPVPVCRARQVCLGAEES